MSEHILSVLSPILAKDARFFLAEKACESRRTEKKNYNTMINKLIHLLHIIGYVL
jgi:hypothetical protein